MSSRRAWLLMWASGFALAELAAGLSIGQFALRGRAEAAIFLIFRPWLLILIALVAMRWPLVERWKLYALFILLASGSEALLVDLLGAPSAMIEAARSVAASLALALLLDLLTALCVRLPGWRGVAGAALAGLALIVVPGPLALFERIALRGEPARPARKPALALLTGLPLVWGEGGVGAVLGGPRAGTAAYELLSVAFAVRPIDAATPEALRGAALLLIAQARPPGPAGLVAIDRWVRGGGRALILTDPELRWPSDLALGDPRRPPGDDGLGPLLAHWGLSLETPRAGKLVVTRDIGGYRVVMAAPGRFFVTGSHCATAQDGLFADCRIGRGRVALLADADLLHDLLWAGPGPIGTSRAGRLADNAALIARRLEQLNGRAAQADRVDWITRPESFDVAVVAAAIAPILGLFLGLILPIRGRGASPRKDPHTLIHRGEAGTDKEQ